MKNPFIKDEEHSGLLLAGIVIGAVAAGALTYIYLKKQAELRTAAAELKAHAQDYLKAKAPKKHKRRTDIHELEDLAGH